MTDEASNPQPTDDDRVSETTKFYESLDQTVDYYAGPHRTLQMLSNSADIGGLGTGVPVTLFLQGGMMAGHIASSQDYDRWLADQYRESLRHAFSDGELPEGYERFARFAFADGADEIDEAVESDTKAFEEHGITTSRWLLTRHICLKDAHFTVPGVPSIKREYVSVQLSHVAA